MHTIPTSDRTPAVLRFVVPLVALATLMTGALGHHLEVPSSSHTGRPAVDRLA